MYSVQFIQIGLYLFKSMSFPCSYPSINCLTTSEIVVNINSCVDAVFPEIEEKLESIMRWKVFGIVPFCFPMIELIWKVDDDFLENICLFIEQEHRKI